MNEEFDGTIEHGDDGMTITFREQSMTIPCDQTVDFIERLQERLDVEHPKLIPWA